MLKKSGFRERYNLWQVFIFPLYRMIISICEPAGSTTTEKNIQLLRQKARTSLKKFCLNPRCAPVELFDQMTKFNNYNLSELQSYWEIQALYHTNESVIENRKGYVQNEYEQIELKPIRQFNRNIDEILKIINNH